MSNINTFTPNASKLNLDNCYNQQHKEIPSISQIPPQDEPYESRNIAKTVQRQKPNNHRR